MTDKDFIFHCRHHSRAQFYRAVIRFVAMQIEKRK